MKIKNLIYFVWVFLIGLFVACEDDDSLFSGDENYITNFRLVQGEHTYTGTIAGDSLILAVPEYVSFKNAIVEFTASENATLTPDPSTITDWNESRTFTVTSYNKTQRTYKYLVVRTLLAQEGDVVLTTPEEIEAFAARGINKVEGNVVIGKLMGSVKEDTLTSLALLASLKEVTGKITINPTYGGRSLEGLQSLEKVGSLVMLSRASQYGALGLLNLKEIDLPNLKKVGSELTLAADTLYTVNLSALESVGGSIKFETRDIRKMNLPALKMIAGTFSFSGLSPERLELPQLTTVGGKMEIVNILRMKEFLCPALTSVVGITLQQTGPLEKVDFGQLKEVVETLALQWTHRVKEFDFPRLQSVGGFNVYYIEDLEKINLQQLSQVGTQGFNIEFCNNLKDVDLSNLEIVRGKFVLSVSAGDLNTLKEVGGDFSFTVNTENFSGFDHLTRIGGKFTLGGTVNVMNGFKALASIQGTMTLSGMNNVTSIDGFDALKSIGSALTIRSMAKVERISFLSNLQGAHFTECQFSDLPALQGLDISGFTMDKLTIDKVAPDFTLHGTMRLDAEVTLNNCQGINFDGIEYVKTLSATGLAQQESTVYYFKNLKKAGKLSTNLGYSRNTAAMYFSDLEEVEGLLTLSEGNSGSAQFAPTQFPVLKKVGALSYTGVIAVLELPVLESVEGEFKISTSYQNGPVKMLEEIRVPRLKNVGGLLLTSNAWNATDYNNIIVDLTCFEALESAEYVTIEKQAGLVSYVGLEKIIDKLEEGSWKTSENAYNPTLEEVKNGKLEKTE